MKIQQGIRTAVLAAFLGACGMGASAQVVSEIEANHPIGSAQGLTLGGVGSVTTVNGILGRMDCPSLPPFPNPPPAGCLDADFYYFDAREGTVLNVDVAKTGVRNLDTFLTIFSPSPGYAILRLNGDIVRLSNMNSRIENFNAPATGRYTIGVSAIVGFNPGGIYQGTSLARTSVGEYTLNVSVVSLPVRQINIDIKPGSGETAPINPKSRGNIPVALLGSATFDVRNINVDVKTLTFGATGDETSLLRCGKGGEDVNGDGFPDLVCHFDTQTGKFDEGDLEGILKGWTKDGNAYEGRGWLKVKPAKKDD
jgi:hypothetical protein